MSKGHDELLLRTSNDIVADVFLGNGTAESLCAKLVAVAVPNEERWFVTRRRSAELL
jgi:hypothetical protein